MNTTSMPGCQPGATATRRSATLMASMRAMKMAMGSARFTSTPSRASGRCCAPGCARTAASRRTNCRCISVSSSSCTTPVAAARLCLALLSAAWPGEAPHHPGTRKERPEISRFPHTERPHMPGSPTTPGWTGTCDDAPVHVAFRDFDHVGTRDYLAFAAPWLAYALPYRRFAVTLTGANARLGADVARYA